MATSRALEQALEAQKLDQGDEYYYLHKKLDDNFEVVSDLERMLLLETTDRERVVAGYETKTEDLKALNVHELGPLRVTVAELEDQITAHQEVSLLKAEGVITTMWLYCTCSRRAQSSQSQYTHFNTTYAQYFIYSKVEGRRKQLLLGISALEEANELSLLAESRHEVQERERLRRYRIFFKTLFALPCTFLATTSITAEKQCFQSAYVSAHRYVP
eukprot:16616-Heterococcus_DN1.PRE.5